MIAGHNKAIAHHVFLASTAVLMMKQSLLMSGVLSFNPLKYLIVFLSTLFVYQIASSNISFPTKKRKNPLNPVELLKLFVLILLIVITSIQMLSKIEILLLLILLAASLAYFTSIGKWKGLRSIPAVKPVLLALTWSLVTVLFPLITSWNSNTDFILLLQRFLFMLTICIIYNLRDVETDKRHGVVTIAIMVGEKNTKLIAGFFLLLFAISVALYEPQLYFKSALLLSALITALVINKAKINGKEFYYKYIIDGCMALQALLIVSSAFYSV